MTNKKHKPDLEILALMGEEESEKLLNRTKNKASNKAKGQKKRNLYSEEMVCKADRKPVKSFGKKADRKAVKSSGKKSKPSILKLMSNNGGRLQNQRAKHQTGSPRFF